MDAEFSYFIDVVKQNCDISDASSAGIFSICGLALRLRDLYKWEHKLPPWIEKNSSQIIDWIDQKEQLWEKIAENKFSKLPLFENNYDPFDTIDINIKLAPHKLYYGAGYAHSLKPSFFLAQIENIKTINNVKIFTLSKELARDILTIPALTQDNSVVFRKDSARLLLWDQMAYLKKSGQPALFFALKQCGLPDPKPETRKLYLEKILSVQTETYIYHEIGEIKDTVFNIDIWRNLISEFAHTPVELLARTVKDLLADTHPMGTLNNIIKKKNIAGLGFYAAFIDGFLKIIFPQLRTAFENFLSTRDWKIIESARETGFATSKQYAQNMIEIFQKGQKRNDIKWASDEINEKLIKPLLK